MENESEKPKHIVPGRLTLEQLRKEEQEMREFQEVTHPKQNQKFLSAMSMMSVGLDFAVILAAPLIAGIFLGEWLDKKFGTSYLVILGILLAMAVSSVGIYRHTKRVVKLLKRKK